MDPLATAATTAQTAAAIPECSCTRARSALQSRASYLYSVYTKEAPRRLAPFTAMEQELLNAAMVAVGLLAATMHWALNSEEILRLDSFWIRLILCWWYAARAFWQAAWYLKLGSFVVHMVLIGGLVRKLWLDKSQYVLQMVRIATRKLAPVPFFLLWRAGYQRNQFDPVSCSLCQRRDRWRPSAAALAMEEFMRPTPQQQQQGNVEREPLSDEE
jgi:hypothetical protein